VNTRIALPGGREHLLRVHVPDGDAPAGGWPVIWLLDLPTTWAPMPEALSAADAGAVVVGIGWDEGPVDPGLRRRDFTLPARDEPPPPRGAEAWGMDGDCTRFLALLCDHIVPATLPGLPADPARQMLAGHSLSGLFVLHAMLERPGVFAAHAAASPSLWWDGARLMESTAARDLSALAGHPVLVTVGGGEQKVGPEKPPEVDGEESAALLGEAHMVDNASAFAEALAAGGVDARFELFEDLGHHAVLPAAMAAVLAFAAALSPRGAAAPSPNAGSGRCSPADSA
jgi:predicted alpha/beta superfamily hydrolase